VPEQQEFRARLGPGGKYGKVAFVRVPFDIQDVWGRAIVHVKGKVNGVTFRTTVGRKGEPSYGENGYETT